jgi:hypothetical protein
MKPLSSKIYKKYYVGIDVETYGKTNKFYSCGLYWEEYDKEMFKYFTDREECIKFILSRKFRNKLFVATNLDFDFTVLFYKTDYWNDFKILSRNGKIIQCSYKFKQNNGTIRFIDTLNYYMGSVESLGKIINSHKLEKPGFLGKKPITNEEKKELMIYNKQDCFVSYTFMNFFQECINKLGGNVKLTIASTSLALWRGKFQNDYIVKEAYMLKDDSVKDFIFEAYYGGRTEVFSRGKFDNVNYYDVNSLYPFCMKNEFPLPNSVKDIQKEDLSINNIIRYHGVTKALIEAPDINIPLLPYRKNGKLLFPVGKFTGTYNNIELRKAIELGYKIIPLKQIIYTMTFRPFDEFIDTLYNERLRQKELKNPFELVCKILMNGLYGKFGTKQMEEYKLLNMPNCTYEEMKKAVGSDDFDVKDDMIIVKHIKKFNGIYAFPILSSYVTSYARLHMYKYLEKGNVIYMDTDSIATLKTIEGCSKELGNMKHEGLYNDCIFIKPKMYKLGDNIKIKGIRKSNNEDIQNVMIGNSITKEKYSKLRESVRRGMSPNTKMNVTKKVDIIDNKRTWEHNSLDTVSRSTPMVLDE